MKILKINSFFKKIGSFQVRFRWPVLFFALALAAMGISGLQKMYTTNSRDQWFDDAELIEIQTEAFEDQFGNNDKIGILVEAEDVFHPEVLQMIRDLGNAFLDSVPYADEITSLVELEISVGTEEGMAVINPFEDGIPDDPDEMDEIRKLILSRQALVNKLVSDDCTETWLSLDLLEYPEKEVWEQETNLDPMFQVGEAVIRVLGNGDWESDRYTLKAAGMPYSETKERDFFARETAMRIGSGFLVMLLLLILFVRSFRGVIVPVFTVIMGVIVVFGTMGWLGIGVDSTMMTLPVLLGMALSVGYSLHLINAFKHSFRKTGKRKESVITAVEETGWPIFFTAATTMGSVMSFATVGILTIQWLGFTCAAVVLADYLLVMTLIPVLMSFGKDHEPKPKSAAADAFFVKRWFRSFRRWRWSMREHSLKRQSSFLERWLHGLGVFVLRRKVAILIVSALFFLAIAPGILKISTNMDSFRFIGLKVPYVKTLHEVVHSQLGSYMNYNISITYEEADAIKDPKVMQEFDELLNMVGAFDLTKKNKGAPRVFSIVDIIKEMNQTLHSDSMEYHVIPNNSQMIAQVLLLYEMSGGTKTFQWIDEDYSMLRAQVQMYKFESGEIVWELDQIREFVETRMPGAALTIVGTAVQFAELNGKIVAGELKSVAVALLIISALLIAVFGSFKTGLIGMVPNFAPLIVLGGFMGYLDSPLDMMTMTIMPMILGIAVDDTIHFINHIKYEFEKCGRYREAILTAFSTVGKTLAMTTTILVATFAMYMTSPVANLGRVGLLASVGLLTALVTDYLVTPALIIMTKPFGKEKKETQA
ncbi:MAG: MMPL family transporter [Bacteroidales bacterium]|nr:MMPL family transporter [Bacteroidales bacterium]